MTERDGLSDEEARRAAAGDEEANAEADRAWDDTDRTAGQAPTG